MSRSRSDVTSARPDRESAGADPLRPSDHVDGAADGGGDDVAQPRLSPVGWLRWGWRQLTSMRTALVLLLLLAIAAVPGSIYPQRSADPNGVTQYYTDNPDLAPVLDNLQLFDVYSSAWFSAIYILLFISLIGCIIPRTKHHAKALRARPPRTPARLSRLADHRTVEVPRSDGTDAAVGAQEAVALAQKQLRQAGYRVERYDRRGVFSVSAERGYLRETGNLVFHAALVGVLLSVGIGGAYTYTGQRVVVEGTTFVNALTDYSSFNPGRLVDEENLTPYSMSLDTFDVTYQAVGAAGSAQAGDYSANITVLQPGSDPQEESVRVNHPLQLAGDSIYLMGNGYAPTVRVRDAAGDIVYEDSVPFLPQDTNLTSLGVVKIADGLPDQLGLVGFFYPTVGELDSGALTSVWPDLVSPVMTFSVYAGDLGIDDGTPRSVYTLDPTGMDQLAGPGTDVDSIELTPGQSADLPDGLGSVEFVDESPADAQTWSDSVKRFASLSIHRDIAAPWVLVFASLATLGLLLALFVPRRRVWVKAEAADDTVRIEYAALARGEDPALAAALEQIERRHLRVLGVDPAPGGPSAPRP